MKWFVVAVCVIGAVSALPNKLPTSRRQGKQASYGEQQANTLYGAPSEQADSLYGAPSEQADSLYGAPSEQADSLYGAPSDQADSLYGSPSEDNVEVDVRDGSLAGYGDDYLDAQASDLDETSADAAADPLAMLMKSVPGIPGEDYPIYSEAPETSFSCDGQVNGGYYADPEAECQAFHICTSNAEGGLAKYSFLCPNGTIFNQEYFICDWWFNVDCSLAEALAEQRNGDLEAAREEADARLAEENLDTAASEALGTYGAAAPASSGYSAENAASAPVGSSLAGYGY